jgi:hypothetical protein
MEKKNPATITEIMTLKKQKIALQHIENAALNAANKPNPETLLAEMKRIAEMAARGQTCPFED